MHTSTIDSSTNDTVASPQQLEQYGFKYSQRECLFALLLNLFKFEDQKQCYKTFIDEYIIPNKYHHGIARGYKNAVEKALSNDTNKYEGDDRSMHYCYEIEKININNFKGSLLEKILTGSGSISATELNYYAQEFQTTYTMQVIVQVNFVMGPVLDPETFNFKKQQYIFNNASLLDMIMLLGGAQKLQKFLEGKDSGLLKQILDPAHEFQIARDAETQHLSTQQLVVTLDTEYKNNGFIPNWLSGSANREYLVPFLLAKAHCGMELSDAEKDKIKPKPGVIETAGNMLSQFTQYLSNSAGFNAAPQPENPKNNYMSDLSKEKTSNTRSLLNI